MDFISSSETILTLFVNGIGETHMEFMSWKANPLEEFLP